jgi:peptidoglycan hydrolase CwlO-like protein
MTPEELNRTIEFIIASQARMSAKQEQEKQWTEDMFAKMERTDTRLAGVSEELTRLQNHQVELLKHQSEQMDRMDKLHENLSRQYQEILRLLNRIIDRLPPIPPNPN